jgi:6-pyruvoyltetrahydropterin/6-carboxytetrahydropterin synthase
MFSLVFSRRYAMGHRLIAGGSEKCALPHGHNETVTVTLRATDPSPLDGVANMVRPFEHAKAMWHRWIDDRVDHALQLSGVDPLLDWFARYERHRVDRILVTPGDPTTEMLACCMMAKLNAFLTADGGHLRCVEIRIEETPTNTVTFEGDPAAFLPTTANTDPWWHRADMSINDIDMARDRAAPSLAAIAR